MSDNEHADYDLIAPISLPENGIAPTAPGSQEQTDDVAEYDAYFRIEHTEMAPRAWAATVKSVFKDVSQDLPETSLDNEEKARLLDGMAIVLMDSLVSDTACEPRKGGRVA